MLKHAFLPPLALALLVCGCADDEPSTGGTWPPWPMDDIFLETKHVDADNQKEPPTAENASALQDESGLNRKALPPLANAALPKNQEPIQIETTRKPANDRPAAHQPVVKAATLAAPGPSVRMPATKRLCGIDWHTSVDDALKASAIKAKSPSERKPVMCFRVLGNLSGFM